MHVYCKLYNTAHYCVLLLLQHKRLSHVLKQNVDAMRRQNQPHFDCTIIFSIDTCNCNKNMHNQFFQEMYKE